MYPVEVVWSNESKDMNKLLNQEGLFRMLSKDTMIISPGVPITAITIVDSKTKVNYIVIRDSKGSISITPRLNKDGSLYITK